MKVYLAFVNDYFPSDWQDLATDLREFVPHPFAHTHLKINLKNLFSPERNQYHSTKMLSEILKQMPTDGKTILGITNVDIFIPILTFLFGEAQLNGTGAIISTYRLHNEFYGLPKDDKLLYRRTLKEALHELGHTMGLMHCPDYECVMHSSTYVEDIDLKMAGFCVECRKTVAPID